MNDKQQKQPDLTINWQRYAIVAITLVSIHIVGMFGGYEYLASTFQEIPVSMVEPSMSVQCKETITEYNQFKEFLGVGDFITADSEKMSWSDFQFYTGLKTKISELNC